MILNWHHEHLLLVLLVRTGRSYGVDAAANPDHDARPKFETSPLDNVHMWYSHTITSKSRYLCT
jgi:hypothetical protein